ncbi:MAG: DedA family protein [Candidatus Shapirobacteria bacterium]|nr:DedA family protein [Candidatus Shapirobacteria bacterium]MDD4382871.1 DedA family protein [Candidatus Shapirobacteria bacterium]
MEFLMNIIDFVLHIDEHLLIITQTYGTLSYGILAGILFMETGLVFTPFLPGDSLLFAAGALAAKGMFNVVGLYFLLITAVFLGDNVNYWVGRLVGQKLFESNNKLFKRKHLEKTQDFYAKYGTKAVILARFVPIVRTFAPFVAGIGKMPYLKFLTFSVIGSLLWNTLFIFGGFFLGNIPVMKENFEYVVLMIIGVSVVPIGVEIMKAKMKK